MKLDELLTKYAVVVSTDNAFQRRTRLLQSLWREQQRLPMGERSPGLPLGSRLPFEHSPGRGDVAYTGDHACRDATRTRRSVPPPQKIYPWRRRAPTLFK